MKFTDDEKLALVWAMLVLSECDGFKNRTEVRKLNEIATSIGFIVSPSLLNIVNSMKQSTVYASFRETTPEKKAFIKQSLESVASVDGEINELEEKVLFDFQFFGKL